MGYIVIELMPYLMLAFVIGIIVGWCARES